MLTLLFLLCWWPIFLSWVYEHVHIYLHLYLNSVIFSSRNSVNIILISVAVSRYSLYCQWKQSLIVCAATVGKFVGLSDLPVPPEPFGNCPNFIVENHLLEPWEPTWVYTMVESNHGLKRYCKILWARAIPAVTFKSHLDSDRHSDI